MVVVVTFVVGAKTAEVMVEAEVGGVLTALRDRTCGDRDTGTDGLGESSLFIHNLQGRGRSRLPFLQLFPAFALMLPPSSEDLPLSLSSSSTLPSSDMLESSSDAAVWRRLRRLPVTNTSWAQKLTQYRVLCSWGGSGVGGARSPIAILANL